jgi:hypothetical protein
MLGKVLISILLVSWIISWGSGCEPRPYSDTQQVNEATSARESGTSPTNPETTAQATRPIEGERARTLAGYGFSGEEHCAKQLDKIRRAFWRINYDKYSWNAHGPITDRELEAYFGKTGIPRCDALRTTTAPNFRDYFLASDGPEPCDYPGLLAYEQAGNHGAYRHLLMKECILVVSEEQWQAMRADARYVPDAPRIHKVHLAKDKIRRAPRH